MHFKKRVFPSFFYCIMDILQQDKGCRNMEMTKLYNEVHNRDTYEPFFEAKWAYKETEQFDKPATPKAPKELVSQYLLIQQMFNNPLIYCA